jgi:hypothetical protein
MEISQLSKSSMSIQSSMSIKFDEHSIIDEHQTRWAFNHRWTSNRWAFNHRWTLNEWHQQTNHSLSLYNIYDCVWVSLSYESADVNQKNFVSMTNFENGNLAIWLINLMKIRLESRELDENQTWESWTWCKSDDDEPKIWSKSVIRSSLECQLRKHLLTCKEIFHLYDKFQNRSSEKASRELDQNDESKGRELDENQTIWIKSLKKRAL